MTGTSEREDKDERKQQQGNLGQKEAQQDERSRDELAHMGERSKASDDKKR